MVRGLLEKALAPEKLDELFERTAKVQYTRELLFSEVVNLMSLVVCGIRPSVNAAYRAKAQEIGVSRTALYDKLNGIEPEVSIAQLCSTLRQLASHVNLKALCSTPRGPKKPRPERIHAPASMPCFYSPKDEIYTLFLIDDHLQHLTVSPVGLNLIPVNRASA